MKRDRHMTRDGESWPINIRTLGPGAYAVESVTARGTFYTVVLRRDGESCNCPARAICVHIRSCRSQGLPERIEERAPVFVPATDGPRLY